MIFAEIEKEFVCGFMFVIISLKMYQYKKECIPLAWNEIVIQFPDDYI